MFVEAVTKALKARGIKGGAALNIASLLISGLIAAISIYLARDSVDVTSGAAAFALYFTTVRGINSSIYDVIKKNAK